ncbi:MAG: hypothetical protein ACQERB_05060 [Promethearchaeati archaeon]
MESGEKDNGNNKLQDLVLFGDMKSEIRTLEKISKKTEDIDQENQIKLYTELNPQLGKYKYVCMLKNESRAPIKEVKIKIQYPLFLKLTRTIPPTIYHTQIEDKEIEEQSFEQIKVEFDKIQGTENKQITLYFNPTDSLEEQGEIKSFAAFINKDDYVRVINSEPLNIGLKEISIQPKIIPSSEIAEFVNHPEIKKAIKSLGLGSSKPLDYEFLFNRLEVVLRANNFQYITKDKEKHIMWYFGNDLESGNDVLVIAQENNRKLEWIVTSKDPDLIISTITRLTHELKENLLRMGIISSEDQVYNLECKACGNILPKFPEKGKIVSCSKCGVEQVVW